MICEYRVLWDNRMYSNVKFIDWINVQVISKSKDSEEYLYEINQIIIQIKSREMYEHSYNALRCPETLF